MHRETKAKSIPPSVKATVYARDKGLCIRCGRPGNPDAHYISRGQGGLGIEQNIVTLCPVHHRLYDQSEHRAELKISIKGYLDMLYPDFPDGERVYKKWRDYE